MELTYQVSYDLRRYERNLYNCNYNTDTFFSNYYNLQSVHFKLAVEAWKGLIQLRVEAWKGQDLNGFEPVTSRYLWIHGVLLTRYSIAALIHRIIKGIKRVLFWFRVEEQTD